MFFIIKIREKVCGTSAFCCVCCRKNDVKDEEANADVYVMTNSTVTIEVPQKSTGGPIVDQTQNMAEESVEGTSPPAYESLDF